MATCPVHHAILEPVWQIGDRCKVATPSDPNDIEQIRVRSLPEQVAVDAITHQAVTTGFCQGPHGRMHGGVWLRLLRSVIQEVIIAPSRAGRSRPKIEQSWSQLDLRYNTPERKPFEQLPFAKQVTILNVAAAALARELSGTPQFPDSTGQTGSKSVSHPPSLNELMERCIADFRVNPASVTAFRQMVNAMDRSGNFLQKVDRDLTALGIAILSVT